MPNRREFRATTDKMLEIIDELRRIEEQKRGVDYASPDFVKLAEVAAEHARLTFRWAEMQLQMAYAARAAQETDGQHPTVQLENVTPRPIDKILTLWREAQIRLDIAMPGSPEAASAVADIERLREEYQVSHDEVVERS